MCLFVLLVLPEGLATARVLTGCKTELRTSFLGSLLLQFKSPRSLFDSRELLEVRFLSKKGGTV